MMGLRPIKMSSAQEGVAAELRKAILSRQMKELEDHLGKQLFIRGNRKITLTEEGILLRQRAEEIVSLVEKTESEIMLFDETLRGEVCIGRGET